MRGHIRERSPGRWAIILDVKDPTTGKRKRRWHSFAGTKRQAQVECAHLISEIKNGTALDPSKVTLRDYMARWLAHIETQVSPRSCECYREIVESWIVYSNTLAHGGRNGTGLSPRSVVMMHRTISQALKQAVTWNLIVKNPAASCKPPRVERKQMMVLDIDSTASLIEFAKGGRMHMPVLLFALCGLRRAEVAALRWNQFDLDAGCLAVTTSIEQTARGTREKPPKNGKARSVALPAILVEELRRHWIRQAEDLLRVGVRQTDDTHVCLREDFSPWPPRVLTYAFARLIRASGLPRVRLHDLRHGHATHLLRANTHPKVVQERLGHASIQLTLDTYSHVMPSMQTDAANTIDLAMRSAMKRK